MERNLIKQVVLEQKKEISNLLKGRLVSRVIDDNAHKMLSSDLIKVIMGVRRCGKSVLAHQTLQKKDYGYINFDDERLINAKTEDLNTFLEVLKEINPDVQHLLLDEIQNIEGWELFVNRLKRNNYSLTITGSNAKLLSKELATHLTGRHFSIELFPFSFREFLFYKGFIVKEEDFYITEKKAQLNNFLNEYIDQGGFPETFSLEARGSYLRELFDKIVTRDIIIRHSIKDVSNLREIALYSLSNFSSRMTYNKVKRVFDMKSVNTVKNYINYLEETYLIFQVIPFSFKVKEQIKQARKLYSIDTGLIQALVPKVTLDFGKLLENLVFLELKRRQHEIYFYSQTDYEIDFLIKKGADVTHLIQVCHSVEKEETRKREVSALLKAAKNFKCDNLVIITRDQEAEEMVDGKLIKIYPAWKWLLSS